MDIAIIIILSILPLSNIISIVVAEKRHRRITRELQELKNKRPAVCNSGSTYDQVMKDFKDRGQRR